MTDRSVLLLGKGAVADELARFLGACKDEIVHFDESGASLGQLQGQDGMNRVVAVIDVLAEPTLRQTVLATVEPFIGPEVPIFTSALTACATQIAAGLMIPSRVIGFQPWLPAQLKMMEVSQPLQAQQDKQWEQRLAFWQNRGKEVEIVDDLPGLVFPRILAMIVNEAAFALSEGVASVEDIDLAMKKGTNYPHGPFEWADEIGIDEILSVLTTLQRELGDDRYRPAAILRKLVYAGWTGKASKHGFYRYNERGEIA